MWDICRICPVLKNFGVWLSLVEYLNGVQVAAGSNPVTPTTSERTMLRSDFSFTKKNQSRAPSFLLFRKKARLLRLCLCKRRHNASAALPLFCDASLASLLLLSPQSPLYWDFEVFFARCRYLIFTIVESRAPSSLNVGIRT